MITCAQAFHWFNPPAALAEFARVLVPGGLLCLVWNNRDAEVSPFVQQFERLVKRYNPAYDREYRQQDWAGKIASSALFEPAEYKRLAWTWGVTHDGFVGFTRSVSYIRNVVARERIGSFEGELRRLMAQHHPDGTCAIPMRVDCWTARRRAT
jgi:SAM-dependent methyltransferase